MSLPKWIKDRQPCLYGDCDKLAKALSIAIEALERLHDQAHKPCVSEICFAKEALARIAKMGDA